MGFNVRLACSVLGAAALVAAGSMIVMNDGRDVPVETPDPASARMEELSREMAVAEDDARRNIVEAIKLLSQCEEGVVWNEKVAANYARLVNASLNPSLKNLTDT